MGICVMVQCERQRPKHQSTKEELEGNDIGNRRKFENKNKTVGNYIREVREVIISMK